MLLLVFFDIFVSFQFPNFSIESTVHLALVVCDLVQQNSTENEFHLGVWDEAKPATTKKIGF